MSKKLNGSKYCYVSLTIQLNISRLFTHSLQIKNLYFQQFSLAWAQFIAYTQLNIKKSLFQTIQSNVITQFSSIWTNDRILSGATTPC